MPRFSEETSALDAVMGLGERSVRKTYYPELQRRMRDLERFRAVLDATPEVILVVACSDGRLVDANDHAAVELGYDTRELLALDVAELVLPGDAAAVRDFIRGSGSGRATVATRMRRRDGSSFPAEMSLQRVRHDDAWYAVAVCRDIGDRIRVEEGLRREEVLERVRAELDQRVRERTRELEESRRLLQRVVAAAPVPIAYLDRKERYVFANEGYTLRHGHTQESIRGLAIAEVLGPTAYRVVRPHLREIFRGSEKESFHVERISPDGGGTREYLVGYAPDRDAGGELQGIIIALNDITELKATEAQLRTAKERLEALAELNEMQGSPVEELVRFAVEKGARLTGSAVGCVSIIEEKGELIVLHPWSLYGNDECTLPGSTVTVAADVGLWGEAVRTRRPVIFNAFPERTDSRYPPGHVDISRLLAIPVFEGERVVMVAGVANKGSDYDEEDARHLALLMDGLWHILQRREAARALVKAKEAAETGNRAKTEFLANMSHEMRTPLAAVLGMLDLVLEMAIGPEERHLLTCARRSGKGLLRIIADLLDFTRMETGKMLLRSEEFRVRETVAAALAPSAPAAEAKGVELRVSVAPEVPETMRGDEDRVQRVLAALVENGVKFTDQGKVEVEVRRERDSDGSEGLVFSVRDTGIGIATDHLPTLFQKFMQVDASSTRRYGGTGMGLAFSRRLVELMGGRIWVESIYGKGSTFSFFLPLVPPSLRQPDLDG